MDFKIKLLKSTGELCRQWRKNKNLTMKEVADLYGITESGVSRIENGESNNLMYFLFAQSGFEWLGVYNLLQDYLCDEVKQ